MSGRWIFALAATVVLAMTGCGDDGGSTEPDTNEPPSAVADLDAAAAGDSSITLTWTAPTDPGKTGSVAIYDIRQSTSPITSENWSSAASSLVPADSTGEGATRNHAVSGLDLGTAYWFAVRTADDDNDWSDLSNVASASTDSIDDRLIAYYPLVDDSVDVAGGNDPMTLKNTPFQSGGISCNGIYIGDDSENGSHAITPELDSLDFESFTVRARFRVDDYAQQAGNPVFVGGDGWRWLGYYLEADSTVSLMYNGSGRIRSDETYETETWYEGTITYDGTVLRLYIDDRLAVTETATLTHGDNGNFGISNFSNGFAFEGIFGRLKVYDGVVAP